MTLDEQIAKQDAESVRATLARMVGQAELLTSAEFIVRLNWARQALSKALGSNRVFYVDSRASAISQRSTPTRRTSARSSKR